MNQTVWRASLVKLHAHSHEPDSVKGVTDNTTHTVMNGSDSLFIKEVGHLKAMQSCTPPTTHKHIATNTVTCTLSLTWTHPHTFLKYLPHTYGYLTREAKMDPPIQLLNRLSAELAAAMIFSRMLYRAKEHRDHNNDLYRWCCDPDNQVKSSHVKWFISETPVGVHERTSMKEHLVRRQ